MSLPSDVDLTTLSVTFVQGTAQNEQSYIDAIDKQIEALQAQRTQHEEKRDTCYAELARRERTLAMSRNFKKLTVGQRVRHDFTGSHGTIVALEPDGWLRVKRADTGEVLWWSYRYTYAEDDEVSHASLRNFDADFAKEVFADDYLPEYDIQDWANDDDQA